MSSNCTAMENMTLPSSPEDLTSPFAKLCIDLVLQIADFLPSESVLALALTTKTLFNSQALWRLRGPYVQHSPGRHAQPIARYSPDWIYCDFCFRLHPRRDTPKITDGWRELHPCPLRPEHPIWLHFDTWNYHVQFEDVYKVMTMHRWGAPYGDALDSLAVKLDWQVMRYDAGHEELNRYLATTGRCLTKFVVTPEIIDGQLLLHTIQRVWYDRDV
ncbi:unnamed protein product [Aureobasidium vineae]|uniref:F-box domain-containing protein n=1 Tax=Aureobasidium vineae TaxID=2773715 RepID=A0A9N8PCC7_9PEZI|nr:unnamed protein product [Aureobasidium vineae]